MKKNFFLTLMLALVALFSIETATAQAPVDSPKEAITGLLNRIGGNGAADKFEIVIDANLAENGKDVFIITSQNDKPCIKGNSQLSVATGINWYLNHYAHINLTWNNLTTDLSDVKLPVPTSEEKHVCNTTYRYDFNTCTFSYSMAFWTWDRWQKEIDWMALHGINAPLNLVGLDVLWRNVLKDEKIGYSDAEIAQYIAGPGFIAWFAMNNLEGWGGTINSPSTGVDMSGNPEWWYTRQEQLCRNMLQRMRELGMQPVIPGFSGQVPNSMAGKTISGINSAHIINNGSWEGYTRPDIINPATDSYDYMAEIYYKHLEELMGVSEFYSIDPFHEGNSLPSPATNEGTYPGIMESLDEYYDNVSEEVKTKYNAPEKTKWIIQKWQALPQKDAFTAMANKGYGDRFIGLDLFADAPGKAEWDDDFFSDCDFIFCMLHNFGGRSGLHGRLETVMTNYFRALEKDDCMGIGATPEGTETNPILYDMLFELPWMTPGNHLTADEWVKNYSYSRYGVKSETAENALLYLKESVWDCPSDQQGTTEAVILARPAWTVDRVSTWVSATVYWDTQDVLLAADQLYSVKDLVTENGGEDGVTNYNYDFIDVVRQAMVDYAAQLLPLIKTAHESGDNAEYTRLYQLYLQLMLDLDTMLSYDENFKLERWTSLARNIANEVSGTTENDRNWLEWNARTQVTVWSNQDNGLHDYSNRCWAGLIKDFHYKRWEKFFTTNGGSFSGGWRSGFEYPWTVDFNDTYNLAGDYSKVVIPTDMTATEKAAQTFGNYFGRVKGATKNYIFPMGVATNATKSDVIPEVYRDKTVELPLIIGKNVTISSVWIDLNNDGAASDKENLAVTDGNKVAIPADAAIGKTTAKVTYSDGTVITFNLALIEDITENRTVTAVAGANGSVAIEGADGTTVTNALAVKMIATANTGYNFENWTDAGGNVVSNDNPFIYYGKEEATFTANFIQDRWGVVACGDDVDGQGVVKDEAAVINDISNNKQYIPELTLAYYNREAETIFEATSAPTSIFTTIPQIINVPQGASFDIEYKGIDNFKHCYFRAYIDLNADGDFDDEGELLKEVGTKDGQNTAVCSNKINVLLPYNMPLGITHMRLRFDSAWNIGEGAKDPSVRPVYEIILNVTEFSEKAAHITVATNSEEWGTVKVWTDETPDNSTRTEWDVTKGVPFFMAAEKTSEDVEFLGWYDQYGRLVTENLEHTMYACEDATYTARFRKFLEIDGWQIEYRTQPGSDVVTTKLANGVKPVAGKKYYIYAPTRPTNDGEYVNRYLYNNSGTLTLSTTESTAASYLWLCSVENGKYVFQNVADPTKYLMHKGLTSSSYGFELGTGTTYYEGLTMQSVPGDGETRNLFFVINDDGSGFNQSTRAHNQSTEDHCTDFVFTEVSTPDVVILTNIRKSGKHDLEIPETVEILGEQLKIVGFDNGLFKDNKDLWTISLPATIEQLSSVVLFKTSLKGENTPVDNSDDSPSKLTQVIDLKGLVLKNSEPWKIEIEYSSDGVSSFNQWGSFLLEHNGTELLYLTTEKQDSRGWFVRLPFLGSNGQDSFKEHTIGKISKFTVLLDNKGNGKATITITNSEGVQLTSSEFNFTNDNISQFTARIPTGLDITNFEVLAGAEPDPFEGCTNLLDITVADDCQGGYIVDGREFKNASGDVLHTLASEDKREKLLALDELIDLTEALIAEVATNVDPTGKATAIDLQANDPNAAFYVSTNADQNTGGGNKDGAGIAGLVDNSNDTYFHSRWSGTDVNATHHIEVDLGEGNRLSEFKFSYVSANGPDPTKIVVKGSNNGEQFDQIGDIIIKDAINSGATYGSDIIEAEQSYRYLRFEVAESYRWDSNATPQGEYCFSMKEFDIYDLTSSAEVAPKYANLARVTAGDVEGVYDSMAEALYVYNNGGTAEQLQAAYEKLKSLYDLLNAKKDKVLNGVYHVKLGGKPLFVAYTATAVPTMSNDAAGYHLFDATTGNTSDANKDLQNTAIANMAAADALFTIVPNDDNSGYTLSAQGLYLHSTRNGDWAPQLLSNDAAQAGVYLFEETETDIYKIRSNRNDIQYMNDWGAVIGNDKSNKENLSTFTLTQVTEYTLNVPANGVTTLCLPFNVVLPEGVIAYDIAKENITVKPRYSTYELVTVATAGETIAANTPVIIKATAGDHILAITMDGEGAKGLGENSLLRSGIVKTTLGEGNNYTFDGENFNRVAANTEIAANQCWMALDENLGDIIYGEAPAFVLTTDEENPVLYKIISKRGEGNAKVLSYDEPTSEKVKIVDNTPNSSYQAWYFMQGENGILIKPYNADGRMLTIESTGDGRDKALIAADGASNFQEWSITKSTQSGCTDYYYIKVVGGEGNAGTFSHNGGFNVTSYMGVWASGFNSNDPGSLFKFVDAEFTNDNARFYQLNDYLPVMNQGIFVGESVGLYSEEGAAALQVKYTEALSVINKGSNVSSSDDCYAMYKALRAAKVDAYNAPAADKVYYIVSTASGDDRKYCTGKYVRTYRTPTGRSCWAGTNTYDQTHLLFDAETGIEQLSLAAFQFEETGKLGEYKMKNLHTGMYVKAFAGTHMGTKEEAQVVKIAGVADGQVTLKIGNNAPMHAQNDFGVIVQLNCDGGNANSPSSWVINEVPQEDLNNIYKLTVPESGVTTLNLAFNVQLPEGVTAYDFVEGDIAQAEGSDRYEFNLTPVAKDGEVLAKNTPVIIKANAGDYNLKVTFSDNNVKNGTPGSVLRGNYWQTTVGTDAVNYLPGVVENEFVFNKVTANETAVTANTVWAVLSSAVNVETIYEFVPAPEPPKVEIAAGKVYRIKNYTVNTPAEYQYHYLVNSNASIVFPTSVEATDKSAMWVCTSADEVNHKYKFVSALGTAAFGWQGVTEEAVEYTISDGTIEGTVTLVSNNISLALTTEAWNYGGKAAFNQASGSAKAQADYWSTDWYLEEVETPGVSYTASINKGNMWATMYLPYAVAIPDGVDVYYATGIADDDKTINLTQLEKTIPARTAALLHRAGDAPSTEATENFEFALAEDVEAVENLFDGTIMRAAIAAPEGTRVYLLTNYNATEKFYWMADEYNANCVLAGAGAGFVKNDANRAYLKIEVNTSPASSFSFRYDGTTGIDEVEGENEVKAIYDLQGRKINKATQRGMYIVNGKKVWVK